MSKEELKGEYIHKGEHKFKVRLPGFIGPQEDVGLGDVIKRATSLVGIRPCGSCEQRADILNRLFTFSGRREH